MNVSIIACFVVAIILFVVGVATFAISDSPFFNLFAGFLLFTSLSLCLGTFFDLREENDQNQSTPYSQVQEETKPNVNENYNYNYNHNYDYNEGETTATYNVQTTTEPCTCSNCLKNN